jgi:hypothetical protein
MFFNAWFLHRVNIVVPVAMAAEDVASADSDSALGFLMVETRMARGRDLVCPVTVLAIVSMKVLLIMMVIIASRAAAA